MRSDTPESLECLFKDGLTAQEYHYYKSWLEESIYPRKVFTINDVLSKLVITYQLAADLLLNMEREGILESRMEEGLDEYRIYWFKERIK